jgi:hypothetical protein
MTHYMLNNHVPDPDKNNSQKNLHTSGRAELITSRAKKNTNLKLQGARINLSIAYIDYQNAFDSIPHSRLEMSTELV